MLNPDVAALLNAHAPLEMLAQQTYLRAALDANRMGLFGLEAWLRAAALEERQHLDRLLSFLNDFDQPNDVPEADPIPSGRFASPRAILDTALDLERAVTRSLSEVLRAAWDAGDVQSYEFIRSYLPEQTDAETEIGDLQALLAAAGANVLEFDELLGERMETD